MARQPLTFFATASVAALLASGCTMKQAPTQSLTGPSELGTSISVTASPDVLTQDGGSQSLVTVTVRDSNGQPAKPTQMRVEIESAGQATDAMGGLSARTIVSDANGRATLIYTAAPPPPPGVGPTTIQIAVTPAGTDFANDVTRRASIRLVPPGVVGPPRSPLVADFGAPLATAGDPAAFNATVTDSTGTNAINQVASFSWDFGDGGTGSGQTVTHTFSKAGVFTVQLTITDIRGLVTYVAHAVTVGAGQNPIATFVISPSSPSANMVVNFNASASTAATGHRIVDYQWDFGDGSGGAGVTTTHAFAATGTYTVLLRVTDDVGRKAVTTQTVTVTAGNPTADFTFNPSSPHTGQVVSFDASGSSPAPGRTIVSYSWIFDDGTTGSGKTVSHTYTVAVTTIFNVRLTVTDDLGNTTSVTKPVPVAFP
jgi:PKD repeat protein